MTAHLEHDRAQALLGAFAADAIDDPDERTFVADHISGCEECRREVHEHFEALALLAPEASVPANIWEGISAAITEESLQASVARTPATVRTLWPRRFAGLAASAAAVAATALIMLWATGDNGLGTPDQDAAIVPAQGATTLTGNVRVFEPRSPSGRIVIQLSNVPDAPSGHHYEVWVLRPGEDVEMEAIGAFTPVGGKARLELPLPGPGEYIAVDISIEENGGSPEHSGTSLAGASLQ